MGAREGRGFFTKGAGLGYATGRKRRGRRSEGRGLMEEGAVSSGREEGPRVGLGEGLPERMVKTPRMRARISEWVGAELGEAFRRGYKDSYRSEARVRVENLRGSGIGGRKTTQKV